MNTSHRFIALSNPDEHISSEEVENTTTPYRTNTFVPTVEALPFNWGPLQRTGKLGLVALPLIAQLAAIPLIFPHPEIIFLIMHLALQYAFIAIFADAFRDKSKMYGAISIAWYPIALMIWLIRSRLLFYPITRPIQYIRSGE